MYAKLDFPEEIIFKERLNNENRHSSEDLGNSSPRLGKYETQKEGKVCLKLIEL